MAYSGIAWPSPSCAPCILETYCGLAAMFLFNSLLSLAAMFYYVSLSHCSLGLLRESFY